MTKRWREALTFTFKGKRFGDHAVELTSLPELTAFQELLLETARAIYYQDHPEAGRLPNRFDEMATLRFRTVESGSTALPLEVAEDVSDQIPLLLPSQPTEVDRAIYLIADAIESVRDGRTLPEMFPKTVVHLFEKWGKTLREGEALALTPRGRRRVEYTRRERERILEFWNQGYEDEADLRGTVLAADVRKGQFVIYPDERTSIPVSFPPETEILVTTALRDHRDRRLRVVGRGEFAPDGTIRKITRVDILEEVSPDATAPIDTKARPIWEEILKLTKNLPNEEFERLPKDLARNVDHYLYGNPKK